MKKRYETKFSVSSLSFNEIENIIKSHPIIFQKIFSKRKVNNIYFDSSDLTSYIDNVEGERDRNKVRIRWYGELFGNCENPILEVKQKIGQLGWKDRYNLNNFKLSKDRYFDYKKVFSPIDNDENYNALKSKLQFLTPTLLNTYERVYYLSFDKKYRITLDKNIDYFSINPIINNFQTFSDEEKTVIELKYNEEDSDGARYITKNFPFRVTKNSKYVIGIDRLRNW